MQIVTANELYEIDRFTMNEIGIPGILLMENAGQAFTRKALDYLNEGDKILILIGTGNNGGDGFVITRVLKSLGFNVDAVLIPKKEKITGDALVHLTALERSGYTVKPFTTVQCLQNYDVIIDAMLGIGLKGNLKSPYQEVIAACNECDAVKLSVDIPSGVTADGNQPIELAFKANVTITLHLPKLSAFTFPARDFYGELEVVSIGIPPKASESVETMRKCWTKQDVCNSIPLRSSSSHKGDYGKGLIIGGSNSMSGAPILTTKASLRAGGGLITLAIPDVIHSTVASQVVEAMFSPWSSELGYFSGEIGLDLSKFNSIAFGPGMGREKGGEIILSELLDTFQAPLIVDADGLFYLTSPKLKEKLKQRLAPTVLTPHSGEMARLLNFSVKELEQNRFEYSRKFAMEYGVFLVLKGPYSIVTTPSGEQYINTTGNPALAKGGTGDVLTGIILAFVMGHSNLQEAISNAVYVHGKAAEELVAQNHSMVDVLATDVINALPLVFRTFF
ncbi:NAD(P)H-hydrate dehydratase [Bacillus sp. Marseille-P3661]|uniref:NAD(P)H-hydrate dehydratase n=1 Tax=Bacillus sp. Marseille-P3661 TaxID=1936234 RepID=UPI000C852614|nr:NAD(P)H-hydrate dehydratase [Bacillus sp. Marseille-P3661]